jgi:hypothetical protein
MREKIDLEELAHLIAEIARTTIDPDAGRRLMELVNTLLTAQGLEPAGSYNSS